MRLAYGLLTNWVGANSQVRGCLDRVDQSTHRSGRHHGRSKRWDRRRPTQLPFSFLLPDRLFGERTRLRNPHSAVVGELSPGLVETSVAMSC